MKNPKTSLYLAVAILFTTAALAQTTTKEPIKKVEAPKTAEEVRKAREEAAKKAAEKKKAEAEARSKALKEMSYSEEFRVSTPKIASGFKIGPNLNFLNLKSFSPYRLSNGSPIINEGLAIKDQLSSNGAIGIGLNASTFMRLTRGSFFLQPEIQFQIKGGKLKLNAFDGLDAPTSLQNGAIEIPLTFGIRHKNFRVFTGPSYAFNFNLNGNTQELLQYYMQEPPTKVFKPSAFNWNLGLGLEKKENLFSLNFNTPVLPAKQIQLGTTSLPSNMQTSPMQIQISVGRIIDTSN